MFKQVFSWMFFANFERYVAAPQICEITNQTCPISLGVDHLTAPCKNDMRSMG